MTDTIAMVTGLGMAVATASSTTTAVDAIPTLSGTALLVWIVLWQGKEINKLRERNRQLADKCKDCRIANRANDLLDDAVKDKIDEFKP